jgi:Trypsin-like peptidase domain
MILVDQQSFQSLYLEMKFGDVHLGTATGFVVLRPNGTPLLMTNWHVVTGRHVETRQPLDQETSAVPEKVLIQHNAKGSIGSCQATMEPLYDKAGDPLWLEHPEHGSQVDVVGLPLRDLNGVDCYPYGYDGPTGHDVATLPAGVKWGPSDPVNVIGFPFGKTAGGAMGIWVQGAVASEPDLDFEGLPRFLIDSRTRKGQSGSPVIYFKRNGWITLADGRPYIIHNALTILLGVYSGRLFEESDLGTVWKTSVVKDIAERGKRGTLP